MTAYEHLYQYLCLSCGLQKRYEFHPELGVKFWDWEDDLKCSACNSLLRDNPMGRPLGTPAEEK